MTDKPDPKKDAEKPDAKEVARERARKDTIREGMEKEEAERNAGKAPTAVSPVFLNQNAKQIMRRDVTMANTARVIWDCNCRDATIEEVLQPQYFWANQDKFLDPTTKLNAYHELHCHDEHFNWEFRARVKKIDRELQVVLISIIKPTPDGLIYHNDLINPELDWSKVDVVDGGPLKWCVRFGTRNLSTGHLTSEDAYDWLHRKRRAFKATQADRKAA